MGQSRAKSTKAVRTNAVDFDDNISCPVSLQNVNFSASCMSRGGAACTTWPNVPVPKSPFTAAGPKNWAWLNVLNVSNRNWSAFLSVSANDRINAISKLNEPG